MAEARKTVTIIFADVTGSTALGEQTDPEVMRRLMERYFEEMRTVLEKHGGTVEKFIGDAVMAVFGIPTVHEDDALRAVRAAAEMRERLVALNEEFERDRRVTIALRTGVNTGEVIAGDPSQGQAFATGDAVNVAARLEQAAEPGEILLGELTHRLVREAVRAAAVDPLEVKGKSQALGAWRLAEMLPEVPTLIRCIDAPFVGRDEELAKLCEAFESTRGTSSAQLVTVLGPPGIGKSRLVRELLASSTAAANLALVLYDAGDYEEAERLSYVSEEAGSPQDVATQAGWRAARAMVMARRGRFDEAEKLALDALARARASDYVETTADSYLSLGEVLRLAGRAEEAREAVESALEIFERKGFALSAGAVRAKLAELQTSGSPSQ